MKSINPKARTCVELYLFDFANKIVPEYPVVRLVSFITDKLLWDASKIELTWSLSKIRPQNDLYI